MLIGSDLINQDSETYFIAEIGSNFDGSMKRALRLIDIAKDCGANAVKFQHYTAETLVSDNGFRNLGKQLSHQKEWTGSVFEVYNKASLNKEWTKELHQYSKSKGLGFLTSPYSKELIDYTAEFLDAIKIGSGDITWTEIIEYSAKQNKPILLGTGASDINEVDDAVKAITKHNNQFCIMQCNTNYEGKKEDFKYQNLNVLKEYKKRYPNALLGLSCHMPGHLSVLASVSLGAKIIEKHFTDDNSRPGPDHKFAMNPESWENMVQETRNLESLLGDRIKKIEKNEIDTSVVQRRSIRLRENMMKGETIQMQNLEILRPCPRDALKPSEIELVIGKKLKKNLKKGDAISKNDI
tara:strand:+ start:458 stop:1513 length:1056 start_codon:yes stop_codon:yes gene_type:complete